MAQSFYPLTPVDITPASKDSWQDVNVDAYAPVGATGAILHVTNTGYTLYALGLRKNGSTDNRYSSMSDTTHCWAMIGVDTNRIFEAYVGLSITIYLVGYTTSGVTFFTNAYNKTPGSAGSWQDVNCSVQCPGAVGLIFEVQAYYSYQFGFRKNGSTDDRKAAPYYPHDCFTVVIGCDSSQICEAYLTSIAYQRAWLVGYITDGATFNTNATNVSLGSAGSWIDLASLPEDSVFGIYENTGANFFGLRQDGSSENIFVEGVHSWGIVACLDRIVEGKIGDITRTTFLIGAASGEITATEQSVVGSLSFSGSLGTSRIRIVGAGGSLGLGAVMSKLTDKNMSGGLSFAGLCSRRTYKSLAGVLTSAGSLIKMTQKPLAGTLTLAGSLLKETQKALDGVLNFAGDAVKSTSKALGGAFTPSGLLTPSRIIPQAIGGALTFAGSLGTAVVTITQQAVGGALSFAGSVVLSKIWIVDLAGELTAAGELVKQTSKNLLGEITPSGGLTRLIIMAFGGSLSFTASLIKNTSKNVVGLLHITGTPTKYTRKLVNGTITLGGGLKKLTSKILAGILSLAGNLPHPGRDLTMEVSLRPYRDMATETKPYRDMTVETKED